MLQIKSFVFSPIQENTYILYNEFNECIIIDPGCYFDDERNELTTFIEERKLQPKMLLNTHCHLDHIFGNRYIAQKYDLILQIHDQEKKMLDLAPASGLMYNLPFDNYTGNLQYLLPGNKITLGSDELEIIFNPGHSPGSLSFYNAAENFIISGDALFYESIGRTDLPFGDYDILITAIKEKLLVLPGETKVYSGHGEVTTIGHEKEHNPFLN
ncbi:MAG: MBL fold metallo-hydrolase [Ferruginibacter sp.]